MLLLAIVIFFYPDESVSDSYRGCVASANQAAIRFPDTLEQNLKVCDTLK